MHDTEQRPDRRSFLATVAGASTALAAAAIAETASAEKLPPLHPLASAAQGPWNLGWVDRLNRAKYRIAFDVTEIAGGTPLVSAFFALRDYAAVYQATDSDMGIALVVRHAALPIVLGDSAWSRFKLGQSNKVKDPVTGEDAVRNPFLKTDPGQKTALYDPRAAADTLIGRGVAFLCCNEALGHLAEMLGRQASLATDEVRQMLVASLVPGTLLVPSGIFALARAEQAGCGYIRSS